MTAKNSLPNLHQHLPMVEDGINIIQIGVGGTGGQVANNILRTIGGMARDMQDRMRYIGIDGDTFETKNLGRQLCVPNDMGKNKAQVIVGRYANAYNVSTDSAAYIDSYITGKNDILENIHSGFTNIIIDNLDKNKPRNWINDAVKEYIQTYRFGYIYIISTGNGEWNGQVTMGCAHKSNSKILTYTPGKTIIDAPYHFSIPSPYLVSPELLDITVDEKEEALSCADRALANVQTLAANQTAANICFNYANSIISQFINQVEDRPDCPQSVGTVRFNALNNSYTMERLTDEYLAKGIL